MKKYLSMLAVLAVAASAFAQGTVAFQNNNASRVSANGAFIEPGQGSAMLIWAPASAAAPSAYAQTDPAAWFTANPAWLAVPSSVIAIGPTPGRFNKGEVRIDQVTPAGGTIQAIVAGWTGNYTDLQAAFNGNAAIGFSAPFTIDTGDPTTVPPGTAAGITGAGQFTGLNALPTGGVIPEPSTFALAGLGVAALLVLRRRS